MLLVWWVYFKQVCNHITIIKIAANLEEYVTKLVSINLIVYTLL